MDPVSIVGITVTTASLLKQLLSASLGLQSIVREIKSIDEAAEGLAEELEAFKQILLVFETALRTSELVPDVCRWWDPSRLEELLSNVVKTFSRLEAIIKDVGKQKSELSSIRQYWRSKNYDKEIDHLRLRIKTYMTALQIPIELGKM
jgi:Fungal N-terminal domain of STAND proteins